MSATLAREERITAPILRRVDRAVAELQHELVKAHTTGQPVPALNRKVARLIGVMRWAAVQAVDRTPGLERADVADTLAWRISRVRALVKVIKTQDAPSLGTLLGLPAQARGLGSSLVGKVSDTLVAQHTAQQQAKCGPNDVLIWQPERNACVRCLKYAGRFRGAGETFQGGLSFDPNAPKPDPQARIQGPPLHPHCRCELAVIPQSAAADNSKALKREAERSVLKGWALDSESEVARTRAAQNLLDNNVIAPKTVISETRKRLRSGGPFIREVP